MERPVYKRRIRDASGLLSFLADAREESGVPVAWIARLCGLSRQGIYDLERRCEYQVIDYIDRYLDAIGKDWTWFGENVRRIFEAKRRARLDADD